MNVVDIKTRVKRSFGDESGVQITDSDIYQWISDGQLEIVRQNEGVLQSTSLTNSVAGTPDYDVPADFFTIKTVLYNSVKLRGMTLQQFEEYLDGWQNTQLYSQGTPQVYTIYNNKITVFPTPDTSLTNGIKIYYSRRPVVVTSDGSSIDLPETYHPTLVEYCLMRAYEQDEDWNAFSAKSRQVTDSINTLRNNEDLNERVYYPTITLLPEDL